MSIPLQIRSGSQNRSDRSVYEIIFGVFPSFTRGFAQFGSNYDVIVAAVSEILIFFLRSWFCFKIPYKYVRGSENPPRLPFRVLLAGDPPWTLFFSSWMEDMPVSGSSYGALAAAVFEFFYFFLRDWFFLDIPYKYRSGVKKCSDALFRRSTGGRPHGPVLFSQSHPSAPIDRTGKQWTSFIWNRNEWKVITMFGNQPSQRTEETEINENKCSTFWRIYPTRAELAPTTPLKNMRNRSWNTRSHGIFRGLPIWERLRDTLKLWGHRYCESHDCLGIYMLNFKREIANGSNL